MSCMAISIKALAGVRETLVSSFYWHEQTSERPLSLIHAFTGTSCASEVLTKKQAQEFCEKTFIFNSIEYFKGEQARTNSEPVEWGDFIFCLKNYDSKRLSIMQLYKTLQMIDYNTEAKGWLTSSEYENWARRIEYENFKENLKTVKNCLASFIVGRLKEYEDAEWCL